MAETEAQTIRTYLEARPDCVLLADALPDLTSDELLPALREAAGERLLPVIVIGHSEDEAATVAALRRGAQDYLARRQLTPDTLRRAVIRVIERTLLLRSEPAPPRESQPVTPCECQAQKGAALQCSSEIEQQLMLLIEAAGNLIRSPRLDEVLPAILSVSQRLMMADAYAVWRRQPEGDWRVVASAGLSERYVALGAGAKGANLPVPEEPMFLEDPDQSLALATRQTARQAEGIRSLIVLPLRVQGENCATLTFYYRQPHRFTEAERRLADALAGLAAAALGNAELYEEQVRLRRQAEEREQSLRESEERLKLAIAALRGGAWEWDLRTDRIEWSDEMYAVFNQSPRSFRPTIAGWLDWMHPDDRPRGEAALEAARQSGTEVQLEYRTLWPGGRERWLDTRGRALYDESGAPVRIIGITRDITERKRAAEALERYQLLAENSRDIMLFIRQDGRIIEANRAAVEAYGYDYETLLEQTIFDLRDPATAPEVTEQMRQASVAGLRFETRHRRRDGTCFDVEVSSRGALVGGEPLLLSVVRDVTERKRAEAALEEREQLFRSLANTAPTIIWTAAPDGTITFQNQQWLDYCGITPEENTADWPRLALHPDDYERCLAAWQDALEHGTPYEIEVRNRRHDGQYRWFLTRANPVRDAAGRITAWFGSTTDIHDRRVAAEALRESEERLRLVVNAAQIGIYDWDITRDYSTWGGHHARLFGLPPDKDHVTWDEFIGLVHPADRERVRQAARSSVESGEDYDVEYRIVRPDGRTRWIHDQGRTFHDREGRPVRMLGIVKDITERRQAEEDLRESQEMLSLAMRSSRMGAWERDLTSGRVVWGRELEELFGLRPGEFAGTEDEFYDFILPEDRQRVWREIEAAVAERRDYVTEFRFRRASGEIRWMEGRGCAVYAPDGRPLRLYGMGLDITERKQDEQEREGLLERERAARELAEAASRSKDEFVAVVSHELRSPLNAMLGWTKILRAGNIDEVTREHALEVIERSVHMQQELVEDLLDTARIISGKLRLETGPVDLERIVRAAADVVQPAAEARGVELRLELEGGGNVITGDADRLQQVVWNLLSNAIKFTPSGGRVVVRLERADPQMRLTISDTGKGIRPEHLPYVFDRFHQADGSSTRRHGGLGLGLALVKHLIELHGGTVRAESPGAGQGTTFIVNLPVRALRTQVTSRAKNLIALQHGDAPEADKLLAGVRVLVVDDEADAREMVTLLLQGYGAQVTVAASAVEALRALKRPESGLRPHVLVTDIGLPERDGYWLIERVRSLAPEEGGRVPAIALTAFGRASDRIRVLSSGFQTHIPKPVEPAELTLVIARLTGQMEKGAGI
ncbi:MAG TPA: PAS domain-containing protein [Blastocatellia bacterium]|nr:PAS domain-containing protein [Blastocatellia bacterium]